MTIIMDVGNESQPDPDHILMESVEDAARNCSLRLEHLEALNLSNNWEQLMRLYNMCEHTWDPDKTWDIYYWEELIPPLVIYGLTLLLGLIGNLLIIMSILGYRQMKTPTNIFLASLAFADLLLCLICLPVKLAELFAFSWTFGIFLCKFVNYMQNVSAVASVLNLTVMSIERYYAIVYPMKAKSVCTVSKAKKVIVLVWLASFIMGMPTLVVQEHIEVGVVQKVFMCVRGGIDFTIAKSSGNPTMLMPDWVWPAHEIYFSLIILIIPGGLMMAAYGTIVRRMYQCINEQSFLTDEKCQIQLQQTEEKSPPPPKPPPPFKRSLSLMTRKSFIKTTKSETIMMKEIRSSSEAVQRQLSATDTYQRKRSDCCTCCKICEIRSSKSYHSMKSTKSERIKPWITLSHGYVVQKNSFRKFRKVIRMLLVIIVVFILCWAPYLTFMLLQGFGIIGVQLHGFTKHIKTTFTLMAYLNSALNPVIYGFMSKSFRESFYKAVCAAGSCLRWKSSQISSEVARGQSPSDEKIQLCCKHRQEHSATNDHGLRINRSQRRNAYLKRMSAFDSPLAKPQTSVTNMSANAGAELSIF